jgi:hypothetical protein
MTEEEVYALISHHVSPAVGWIRLADRDNAPGSPEVEAAHRDLYLRMRVAAKAILAEMEK